MKLSRRIGVVLLISLFMGGLFSCSDDDKQVSKPVINMDDENAFPANCVTVFRGESFEFNALFTDEQELGSFNIEIHNNFDHHSHSTDDIDCEEEEHKHKSPVKPFVYNKSFTIPSGQTSYQAIVKIDVPTDIDTGSYHFVIRVTNKAAWQEIKGISIKIADRK